MRRNDGAVVALLKAVTDRVDPLPELPPAQVCRRLRERAGLSQELVGSVCGVAHNVVPRWENGQVNRPLALAASRRYRALLAFLIAVDEHGSEVTA